MIVPRHSQPPLVDTCGSGLRFDVPARGEITVVRDARYVVDGNLVTSQGVSAGIDMALWLVGRIHGRDHARAVARYIQYEPAPPYVADEPAEYRTV